jgi:hypothetical protein
MNKLKCRVKRQVPQPSERRGGDLSCKDGAVESSGHLSH